MPKQHPRNHHFLFVGFSALGSVNVGLAVERGGRNGFDLLLRSSLEGRMPTTEGCREDVVWSLQFQISLFALSLLSVDGDRGTGQFSASCVPQADGNINDGPSFASARLVLASTGGASGLISSEDRGGSTIFGLLLGRAFSTQLGGPATASLSPLMITSPSASDRAWRSGELTTDGGDGGALALGAERGLS